MDTAEGVIKYTMNHQTTPLTDSTAMSSINQWRGLLKQLGMVGQDVARYSGYGFGNLSSKVSKQSSIDSEFIITGSQTGHLNYLESKHFSLIKQADTESNWVVSYGLIKPSSEALTHAAVYQANPEINSIIHVHSPEIWNLSHTLKLACTDPSTDYGTAEMAQQVFNLINPHPLSEGIFSMLGHRDGIVSYAQSIEKAAFLLLKTYSLAISVSANTIQSGAESHLRI